MIAILGRQNPPDESLARRMLAAAPHRGGCIGLLRRGSCILGVATRPNFVDASLSSEGELVGALSGRLDNATELRQTLTAMGVPPVSTSDADLVVAAFRVFGDDAPNKMRGSFAGFVTDGKKLWCFRDHIGFKPLFYRDDPRAFLAASEPRQIVVGADLTEEPDLDVVEKIFFGRMVSDTPAALKGVSRQAQATTMSVSADGGISVRQYWDPLEIVETGRISEDDVRDRFLELLDQAAKRSLAGDDVIMLSGGLDSPAVAAYAAPEHRRRTGRNIGALSAVFPDLPSVDERHYIEIVARRFGMDLHTYRPTSRQLDNVDEWSRLFGSPIPILSVPEASEAYTRARNLGYQNVITGEFAEFAFGVPNHIVSHLLMRGRWRALATHLKAERKIGSSRQGMGMQLVHTFVPGRAANWYLRRRGRDDPRRIPNWLDKRKIDELPYRTDLLPPSRDRWRQLQLVGTRGATLTIEADEICAAVAGVTIRRPMADIDLWEFFLSLPAEIKHPDQRFKIFARANLRGVLPDEILDRRGKTFFDDHVMANLDYETLRRLLVQPRHRFPSIDYELLANRIERRDFNRFDWFWARDLASIHAFLNQW